MRTLIALVFFVFAAMPLGFMGLALYEAVTSWGVRDTVETIVCVPYNAMVFVSCLAVGLGLGWLAVAIFCGQALWPFRWRPLA